MNLKTKLDSHAQNLQVKFTDRRTTILVQNRTGGQLKRYCVCYKFAWFI